MPASLILAAAGVGTAATAAIVVSATTMAALTFAINFAVSALITRVFAPSKDNTQNFGTREQIPPSADNCLPVVYGDAWLAGTFVDAVMSIDQKTMYYVVAISHISANGQITYDTTKFYYGDRLITFDGTDQTKVVSLTDTAGNVDTKIGGNPGKLYINLYTSNAAGVITPVNTAQYPHQVMGGADIDVALRWSSSNRQMNGLAFAIIKLNYNSADGFTNLQPLTFKLSHTLNGTGFAKPGDVLYDYLTNEYYGGAVPAANVDATGCTALNVYSDQTITYTPYGGGASTQARYRINGVLNTGDTVLNNINHILTACDSWLSYDAAAGQWSPVINKAEGSSFLFDDSNIVGEIKVSVTDLSSTYNQIEVSFPFKDNKDQAEYVRAETPAGLLYPNEPVNKLSTTFNLVNDSVQAAYLANRVLEQAREDLIVSFASAYPGIQINAGDVVGVTNVEYGWSNKLFRVMKVAEASLPDGNLGARFDLSEYNAQVYDDKDITQFTPVPNSGLPAPQYFGTLTAPFVSASRPNDASPSFDISVTTATGGRIAYINLFFTTSPTPVAGDWILYSSYNRSDADVIPVSSAFSMTNIVLGAGTYYFAVVYGNESAESPLSPISSAFVWAPVKATTPLVDISGFTGFSRNVSGVYTPASATLTAVTTNVTSPTYSWAVTGATPSSGSSSSITLTPSVGAVSVNVSLTVNGSNLTSPLSRNIVMPIIDDGTSGVNGTRTAILDMYKWSATQPTSSFPSGTSTYTWATGQFTAPATTNGWSLVPPASVIGQTLWVARTIYADSGTSATSSISWSATSSFATGASGENGTRTAFLEVYKWSATTPTLFPSGTSTYTWATGAFTAPTTANGWSVTPGATVQGQTLWGCSVRYSDLLTTSTSSVSWTTSTAYPVGYAGQDGNPGDTGPRNAQVFFYYNTATSSAPTAPTTAQVSYDFSTQTASISASGWSTLFNPSGQSTTTANNKWWAVKVVFQETTYGGAYSETISSVFTWQNLDGLVTFTNLSTAQGPLGTGTTFIDGGAITANTLNVNSITSSSAAIVAGRTFGLGTGASAFGFGGTIVANTTDVTASGNLSVGGNTTYAGFATVGATSNSGSGTAGGAFGNATSTAYSSWRTYGLIGQANQAGTFLHVSSGNTGLAATSAYAFYASVGGYGPFTGEHDGLLAKGTVIEPGDIVCDTGFVVIASLIDTITEVVASSSPNQKSAVGIYHQKYQNGYPTSLTEPVTNPDTGIVTQELNPAYSSLVEANDIIVISSVGEGTINVCGENGDIQVGDLIVTSSIAGKGMKQSDDIVRSSTVAKSRQNITFSSPTDVVQISCIYLCG